MKKKYRKIVELIMSRHSRLADELEKITPERAYEIKKEMEYLDSLLIRHPFSEALYSSRLTEFELEKLVSEYGNKG